MKRLLAAIVAGMFAITATVPVIAQEKKEETKAKTETKKKAPAKTTEKKAKTEKKAPAKTTEKKAKTEAKKKPEEKK